ncbi:P-loop containing nucleoside triphosphate hydrolase protein [Gilbertella persicaria]|uniref:P-loop containing nucleoside triphosphate hydrolase protein n=1 Tax=Gilbertella persicaria TaxID=101096 RepID=UPI00221EE8B3|nr:P-loop containing nucleoside triphosphate hydrolase protein [Gilbertella persicaria]KAI8060663.1 P-loop containing nucleoside triphosphate hydrolase protein [Gilbertella persicaria]
MNHYQENCQAVLKHIALVKQLLAENPVCEASELDVYAQRLLNSSSKILVTGDLNSGKSTLVNALLRKNILPVDQQPCTSMFCEVYASQQNELHALNNAQLYNKQDPSTYDTIPLGDLYDLLTQEEPAYKILKLYTNLLDTDSMVSRHHITLIDSPGLNTDSIRSTAMFAQEEDIDVIVFVVNAENHFTLSGREFLSNAVDQHVFIAVNKFDHIRDKERCKRLILEQIRDVSPRTFEQAHDLVHFVSAGYGTDAPEFLELEHKLCSFVLQLGMASRLVPAKQYVSDTTRRMVDIANHQETEIHHQVDALEFDMKTFLAGYSRLIDTQYHIKHTCVDLIQKKMRVIEQQVNEALDTSINTLLSRTISSVPYPGLYSIWQYASTIANTLCSQLQSDLQTIELQAYRETHACIEGMNAVTADQLIDNSRVLARMDSIKPVYDHPIQIDVQASDFLINKMDDKKIALTTASLAALLLETEACGDHTARWLSSCLKPLLGSVAQTHSHRILGWALTCVGLLSVSWTVYSFLSDMPLAVQENLKHKFQKAIEKEQIKQSRVSSIIQQAQHVLETQQTDMLYRIGQMIGVKDQKKAQLEQNLFESKAKWHQLQSWLSRSNTLLKETEFI